MAHTWISSSFKLSCGTLLSISALTRVQNGGARFQPQWPSATGSSHLLYRISTKKISSKMLSCHCVCTCQHSYYSANRHLETTNLLTTFSTLPLLIYGVKHNWSAVIPVTQYQFNNPVPYCQALLPCRCTLQCVIKVWSSCFQLLNQSSNSTHIHTCMYFLQISVNVKLASHLQQPRIQSSFVSDRHQSTPF